MLLTQVLSDNFTTINKSNFGQVFVFRPYCAQRGGRQAVLCSGVDGLKTMNSLYVRTPMTSHRISSVKLSYFPLTVFFNFQTLLMPDTYCSFIFIIKKSFVVLFCE